MPARNVYDELRAITGGMRKQPNADTNLLNLLDSMATILDIHEREIEELQSKAGEIK